MNSRGENAYRYFVPTPNPQASAAGPRRLFQKASGPFKRIRRAYILATRYGCLVTFDFMPLTFPKYRCVLPRRIFRLRCGILAALGLFAVAPGLIAAAPAWAEPIDVTTSSVALDRRDAARQTLGPLTYLGGLRLRSPSRIFGGLSGLEVSEDGRRLLAISDRGFWFSADLVFGADGRLSGLANTDFSRMRGRDGKPLTRRFLQDAEALARDGGDYLVAFEGAHRIWRYSVARGNMAAGVPTHAIPGLRGLPSNGGIEALTVLRPGVLLVLSEDGRTPEGDLRGWLIDGERHGELSFVTQGRFKPTDLAVLPSGDLLVLERSFSGLGGFGVRLSVIGRETVVPGARLVAREIARFRAPLVVDNFEGLAVVEVGGRTLLYMVSDDNFSAFQRNLLLMFELDESRLTSK